MKECVKQCTGPKLCGVESYIMKMDYGMRIFKTNVVSKVYEKKIRLEKAKKNLRKSVNSFQCGGIAGMSTANHLLTLNASGHRLK